MPNGTRKNQENYLKKFSKILVRKDSFYLFPTVALIDLKN